jgi:hypothetical protein
MNANDHDHDDDGQLAQTMQDDNDEWQGIQRDCLGSWRKVFFSILLNFFYIRLRWQSIGLDGTANDKGTGTPLPRTHQHKQHHQLGHHLHVSPPPPTTLTHQHIGVSPTPTQRQHVRPHKERSRRWLGSRRIQVSSPGMIFSFTHTNNYLWLHCNLANRTTSTTKHPKLRWGQPPSTTTTTVATNDDKKGSRRILVCPFLCSTNIYLQLIMCQYTATTTTVTPKIDICT